MAAPLQGYVTPSQYAYTTNDWTKATKIYNNVISGTEVIYSTLGIDRVCLRYVKGKDNHIRVYGLLSTGVYTSLTMTNLKTGNTLKYAGSYGDYYINTSQFESIKFINTAGEAGTTEIQAYVLATNSIQEPPLQIMGHDYNAKEPTITGTTISGASLLTLHQGTMYRAPANIVYYKTDWAGTSYTQLGNPITGADSIYKMIVMDNGNIVVWASNGKVFVTTDNFTTTSLLLDMGTSPTHSLFGAKAYKNYLMFCQYSNVIGASTKAYISEDSGLTCREIFDIYAQPNFAAHGVKNHTHSCAIDPFETTEDGKPMLWMVIGDGTLQQHYFWSKDFGVTWHTVTAYDAPPIQATEVIPLKNCVLFTSDSRVVCVTRYNRPVTGTQVGQYQSIETALLLFEGWGKDAITGVPIGSIPYIDFINSKAYFGWAITGTALSGNIVNDVCKKGQVWATDGYRFYKMFENPTEVSGLGCTAVWGDDLGNILIRVDGASNPYTKFNKSMWG